MFWIFHVQFREEVMHDEPWCQYHGMQVEDMEGARPETDEIRSVISAIKDSSIKIIYWVF
jgi:hypothetical protein